MDHPTKFLLDSGDPNEYREIVALGKKSGDEIWGSTTNPSLIAKKLASKKISQQEAFALQKEIVEEILTIVPGAVSAEVYADETTPAQEMIAQGREIATWNNRVVVKLPTTLEGFKARSVLRKEKIPTNNTLVFSQGQIFAICLHEQIIQKLYGPTNDLFPPFISPFVGRLDDKGENGMQLVENGMQIKWAFDLHLPTTKLAIWMLAASARRVEHIKRGIEAKTELMTIPAKLMKEWFALSKSQKEALDPAAYAKDLTPIEPETFPNSLKAIETIEGFMQAIESEKLSINHPLTDAGIAKFTADWKTIIEDSVE